MKGRIAILIAEKVDFTAKTLSGEDLFNYKGVKSLESYHNSKSIRMQ